MKTPVELLVERHRFRRLFQALLSPCCLGALLILQVGCSSPTTPASSVRPETVGHVLAPVEAAQLAAKLANDECERLYRKRPFTADEHPAVLKGDQYRWGGLNEGGRGGLSALVILGADGSHPKVEVYFSTDTFMPLRTQTPDKERPEPKQR
jgi:hypothetical protein